MGNHVTSTMTGLEGLGAMKTGVGEGSGWREAERALARVGSGVVREFCEMSGEGVGSEVEVRIVGVGEVSSGSSIVKGMGSISTPKEGGLERVSGSGAM